MLVSGAALGAEVYRSTDPDGTVVYTDRPRGDNSETIYVATPRASAPRASVAPTAAANAAAAQAAPLAAAQRQGQAQEQPAEPTAAQLREQRAKNCEIARERQERYSISHRLYRTLPSGEREYLSDAEIDEARSRAAADVGTWCN
jgi:hypothetical protein